MRAILLEGTGGAGRLRVSEVPDPEPKDGEVLVQVRAAGVNFADVLARQGLYPEAPRPPYVPGYESSGEIVAVGAGANGLRLGDRVLCIHAQGGGYAERVSVPAAQAIPIPESLPHQAAVVLPLNYGTAYAALHLTGPLERGMRVFIHAAAGAVGMAAVDLTRRAGLEIVGSASTHFKRERLLAEGVRHVVPSQRLRLDRVAGQLYSDAGFDIVLDSVGGRGIRRGIRALRPGGRLVSLGVGGLSGGGLWGAIRFLLGSPRIATLDLLRESRGLYGINLWRLITRTELVRRILEELIGLAASGEIHPEPGRVLTLADAGVAHQLLESRRNVGKIVLRT